KDNNLFDDTEISIEWIKNLQQVIAQITTNTLFYDLDTIRSFVSGLAMSRLSILQGISGTGKTSLPKVFAEAIGGHCEVVEVQSGWKDKQDLIGYYNTFEKKYYEGKFLKALYKASTPKYRDKPFLIILDEMNLSHPEHYFADILPLMEETDREKQVLSICDKVSGKPEQMIEYDGEFGLKIPDNVWFIGTANHDETTLQFAPKTYDRANIMEMPKNFINFSLDTNIDKESVKSCNKVLLKVFEKSNKNIDNCIEYINEKSNFKKICNNLGIGWGNRLEKQIKQFIPMFLKLGGNQADALDHILSTKILRTIKGRYDLQENILNEMKKELEENFENIFRNIPKKSLEIINT
ncbi:MAG: AAA family ATPase, partial [Sulfurovaceae bacterium]|nr:AAA family ATPase [Sulfurovaceae bacterium]